MLSLALRFILKKTQQHFHSAELTKPTRTTREAPCRRLNVTAAQLYHGDGSFLAAPSPPPPDAPAHRCAEGPGRGGGTRPQLCPPAPLFRPRLRSFASARNVQTPDPPLTRNHKVKGIGQRGPPPPHFQGHALPQEDTGRAPPFPGRPSGP